MLKLTEELRTVAKHRTTASRAVPLGKLRRAKPKYIHRVAERFCIPEKPTSWTDGLTVRRSQKQNTNTSYHNAEELAELHKDSRIPRNLFINLCNPDPNKFDGSSAIRAAERTLKLARAKHPQFDKASFKRQAKVLDKILRKFFGTIKVDLDKLNRSRFGPGGHFTIRLDGPRNPLV